MKAKKRYTFVGNSRTCYRNDRRTITKMVKSDLDIAAGLFTARYRNQVEYTRKRIHATLKPLYGKEIPFATRILSQVVDRIHYIMDETGEDIKTVAKELKTYLGYDTKFFRLQGLREIPCEPERIIAAYKSMKHNEPKERVRAILFRQRISGGDLDLTGDDEQVGVQARGYSALTNLPNTLNDNTLSTVKFDGNVDALLANIFETELELA